MCALELGRLGVTANCLAPTAMTRLVAPLMGGEENVSDEVKEAISPRWVATVATWLASPLSKDVTGRVFDVRGETIAIADGWHRGPDGTNPGGDPEGRRQGDPGAAHQGPPQRRPRRPRRPRPLLTR